MAELVHDHNGLTVRVANPTHIASILALQQTFHHYEKKEDDHLFLFNINNDLFSQSDFENIIDREECVIVQDGEIVVGYMLIDNCSETLGLKDHLKCISVLKEEEMLNPETRWAPRFAELFNPDYKNLDLSRVLLSMLVYISKEKYDAIFSGIFTNQELLIERINLGWKIAYDNGMYFFLVWEMKSTESLC